MCSHSTAHTTVVDRRIHARAHAHTAACIHHTHTCALRTDRIAGNYVYYMRACALAAAVRTTTMYYRTFPRSPNGQWPPPVLRRSSALVSCVLVCVCSGIHISSGVMAAAKQRVRASALSKSCFEILLIALCRTLACLYSHTLHTRT